MLLITSLPEHRKVAAQARAERGQLMRRLFRFRPFAARPTLRKCEVTA